MKVVEILQITSEALKMLSKNDVKKNDWRFVKMYDEFKNMRRLGVKYREAVRLLSLDYHIGRATVERILKRLDKEC